MKSKEKPKPRAGTPAPKPLSAEAKYYQNNDTGAKNSSEAPEETLNQHLSDSAIVLGDITFTEDPSA